MMELLLVVVMLLSLSSLAVICICFAIAKAAELCLWGTSAGSSQVFVWGCAIGTAMAGRDACPHEAVRSKYFFCYEESESEVHVSVDR